MCGEKVRPTAAVRGVRGSPPHVRGKGWSFTQSATKTRITPACAGKRPMHSISCLSCRDHPRMCGEKCLNSLMVAPVTGSPPHVRGKGDSEVISQCTHGITPACAGKSCGSVLRSIAVRDHPRVCGEKRGMMVQTPFFQGSPPRMRGKVGHSQIKRETARITPAYAGKSAILDFSLLLSRDHPRVCGEKTKKIP